MMKVSYSKRLHLAILYLQSMLNKGAVISRLYLVSCAPYHFDTDTYEIEENKVYKGIKSNLIFYL